jgi:hypothetical protein
MDRHQATVDKFSGTIIKRNQEAIMRNARLSHVVVLAGLLAAGTRSSQAAEKSAASQRAKEAWQVKTVWHIGGEGRWDYVTVDPAAKRLYVARSTHVQVLSTETGKIVRDIEGTGGVHGVALVHDAGFIWGHLIYL